MFGQQYLVELEWRVQNDLARQLDRAASGADRLTGRLNTITSAAQAVEARFSSFAGILRGGAEMYASMAIGRTIAQVKEGVVGLNANLETTKVSLAAVLYSQGKTSSVEAGLERAASWLSQMRKDAKDLPGEFEDLLGIVQTSAGAAFNAGLDVESFERLAAQSMAAAKALAVQSDQAGRELAQLLEGRAGAHNVFGTRLGIKAEGFNKLDPTKRVDIITNALAKFEPSIRVFGQTWDAQTSTFQDNIKTFTTIATGPLFSKIVGTFAEVNEWFDKNQAKVKWWAENIGYRLGQAFDEGKAAVEEWWPIISNLATKAYDRFVGIWYEAEPYVKSIVRHLKDFLSDEKAFDRLESIVKLYAGVKVGSGALNLVSGLGGALGGAGALGKIGGWLGIGGGAAGAASAATGAAGTAGAAAVDSAAAAEWAAALKGASVTGQIGASVGAAGAGLTALAGGLVAALVAAIADAGYEIYDAHTKAVTVDAKGGGPYGYNEGEQKFVNRMVAEGIEAADALSKVPDAAALVESGFGATAEQAQQLAFVLDSLAASGDYASIALINAGAMAKQMEREWKKESDDIANQALKYQAQSTGILAMQALDAADALKKKEKDREKAVHGKGGTHIDKVTVSVSGNADPAQVAREVGREFQRMVNNPTSSQYHRNFSTPRSNQF
jgi:hypothetical protein